MWLSRSVKSHGSLLLDLSSTGALVSGAILLIIVYCWLINYQSDTETALDWFAKSDTNLGSEVQRKSYSGSVKVTCD